MSLLLAARLHTALALLGSPHDHSSALLCCDRRLELCPFGGCDSDSGTCPAADPRLGAACSFDDDCEGATDSATKCIAGECRLGSAAGGACVADADCAYGTLRCDEALGYCVGPSSGESCSSAADGCEPGTTCVRSAEGSDGVCAAYEDARCSDDDGCPVSHYVMYNFTSSGSVRGCECRKKHSEPAETIVQTAVACRSGFAVPEQVPADAAGDSSASISGDGTVTVLVCKDERPGGVVIDGDDDFVESQTCAAVGCRDLDAICVCTGDYESQCVPRQRPRARDVIEGFVFDACLRQRCPSGSTRDGACAQAECPMYYQSAQCQAASDAVYAIKGGEEDEELAATLSRGNCVVAGSASRGTPAVGLCVMLLTVVAMVAVDGLRFGGV